LLDPWERISRDFSSWQNLSPDWDAEQGIPPRQEVLDAGRQALRDIKVGGAPVPEHYIAGDGEIGFRWRGDDRFASLSFIDDGHVLAYMHLGDAVRFDMDEPWSSDLNLTPFIKDLRIFV